MSVAPLCSPCLESIDLAGPNLSCSHGFLCVSLPVYFGLHQGARYWYLRFSSRDGFPIAEVSGEGTAPFRASSIRVLDKAKLVLGLLMLEWGARQVSSATGAFSTIKQHCLCIPGAGCEKHQSPAGYLFLITMMVSTFVTVLGDEGGPGILCNFTAYTRTLAWGGEEPRKKARKGTPSRLKGAFVVATTVH